MRKYLLPMLIMSLALCMLAACSQKDDDKKSDSAEEKNNDESSQEENADEELSIEELSDVMIEALDERDMESVASYVHPEKGLLFSPYVYVKDDAVVLDENEVASMMESDEIYEWGTYDGKGTPIELTPADYFDEFMEMEPFLEPDDILIDDLQDRGNTLNNIDEVFPNAQVIEYYNDGSEEYAGIDWSSIVFVYETDAAGSLQLLAIIRDMWTI